MSFAAATARVSSVGIPRPGVRPRSPNFCKMRKNGAQQLRSVSEKFYRTEWLKNVLQGDAGQRTVRGHPGASDSI